MKTRILFTGLIIIILMFGGTNSYAAEYCSTQQVDQNISGKWKGSDSYYLIFNINKENRLCISILEDNSKIERNVRDIVIVDGKLKHFTYYTPSTDGYIIYSNIKIDGNEMQFHWYGTFGDRYGTDTYYRQNK